MNADTPINERVKGLETAQEFIRRDIADVVVGQGEILREIRSIKAESTSQRAKMTMGAAILAYGATWLHKLPFFNG